MSEDQTIDITTDGFVGNDGVFSENWAGRDEFKDNEATLSRYKNVTDLANGLVATKKKFGKNPDSMVEIPSDTSSDDVRSAWAKAKGRLDTSDLYEYTLSDEHAVKLGPLDDKKMTAFKEFAHGQEWSQKQFKDALDYFHSNIASDIDTADISFTETQNARIAEGKAELKKEWLDGYDDKVLLANAVMRKYGGEDAVAEFSAENSPLMLKFLNNISSAMSEDTLKGLKSATAVTATNIQTQIGEIRAKMDVIMKENPSNFKANTQFKELGKQKTELYKKMSA